MYIPAPTPRATSKKIEQNNIVKSQHGTKRDTHLQNFVKKDEQREEEDHKRRETSRKQIPRWQDGKSNRSNKYI